MSRWKFTPLYRKCPRCQLDFSKHFIDSGEYKKYAKNVEADTKKTILSWVTFTHEIVGKTISLNDYSLKWMINPLPETDEKTATKKSKDSRDDNLQSPYVSKKSAAYERLLLISSRIGISQRPLTRQEVQELREIWEDLHDFEDPVVRLYRWVLSKISKKRTVSAPGEKD